jgi:hypothetical protein
MTDDQRNSRIREARHVASLLLDDLESSASPIDAVLMRAKRLAQLMRDTDAQRWLDLETRDYPSSFSFSERGTCEKYAISGRRVVGAESSYYTVSLPALEANIPADEALLGTVEPLPPALIKANERSVFASLKAAIHSYVSDVYLALELGDIA